MLKFLVFSSSCFDLLANQRVHSIESAFIFRALVSSDFSVCRHNQPFVKEMKYLVRSLASASELDAKIAFFANV